MKTGWGFIYRHAKKVIVLVVGVTVILLGFAVVLLPGPGPAPLLILGGLAILGTEYLWARRLLRKTKAVAEKTADRFSNMLPGARCDDEHPSLLRRWIMKIRVPEEKGSVTPPAG